MISEILLCIKAIHGFICDDSSVYICDSTFYMQILNGSKAGNNITEKNTAFSGIINESIFLMKSTIEQVIKGIKSNENYQEP